MFSTDAAYFIACERASLEPSFITYNGDAPDVYVLSVNLRRRSLTKGQVAMITVKARSVSEHQGRSAAEQEGRSETEQTARSLGEQLGVGVAVMGRASTVLQHAPDHVDTVISGAMGLDEAYVIARENKARANSAEAQLARLREEDPPLADRVVEGDLTLAGCLGRTHRARRGGQASAPGCHQAAGRADPPARSVPRHLDLQPVRPRVLQRLAHHPRDHRARHDGTDRDGPGLAGA